MNILFHTLNKCLSIFFNLCNTILTEWRRVYFVKFYADWSLYHKIITQHRQWVLVSPKWYPHMKSRGIQINSLIKQQCSTCLYHTFVLSILFFLFLTVERG